MEENESTEEINAKHTEMAAERAKAKEKAEEMEYIIEDAPVSAVGPYVDPSERKPIHHLK